MAKPQTPRPRMARLLISMLAAAVVWFLLVGRSVSLQDVAESLFLGVKAQFYTAPVTVADTAKARVQFDRDVRNSPADPSVYDFIARLCMASSRYDLAREYLERSLVPCKDAPRPARAELYFLLSQCYVHTNQAKPQQLAIFAAQRAVELNPVSPTYQNAYGYLLADNDWLLSEALARTSQALLLLKKMPDTPQTRFDTAETEDSYGWALYKLGRYDPAVSALNQAIADLPTGDGIDPKAAAEVQGELYYHLGAACRREQRFDAARQALQTALAYDPNNKDAREELDGLKSTAAAAAKSGAPPHEKRQ